MAGPASAQVLAFAARRLLADPVALIFATRDPGGEFTGLPELVVQGLGDADARALLGSFLRVRLDERVFDRIVAETWGNPLALLELPRGLTPEDLAGGFGVLSAPGLPGRIEESFLRRCEALPSAARQLLLVAAAEPAGDPVLVWRAAGRLGIGPDAAAAAEGDGLLVIGARVMFLSGRIVDVPLLLLNAARQFESLDLEMARETYLDTLGAALYAGRLAVGGGVREVAEAARWAPALLQPARGPDLLLDGLALLITEGYAAGMPVLKRALQAFRSGHISNTEGMRWLWLVCQVAIIGWDWETWRLFCARQVSLARDAGALVALPLALITLSTPRAPVE